MKTRIALKLKISKEIGEKEINREKLRKLFKALIVDYEDQINEQQELIENFERTV